MFGMTKPKPKFGSMLPGAMESPYGTPPIAAPQQMAQEGAAAPSPEVRQPGFFKPGGVGRGIAGTVGDFLLQQANMDPVYLPQMQRQQEIAERQRMASVERENGWQDWLKKQEWERDNRGPEIDLREDNAGNVWQFDKRTGQAIGEKPSWVDKTPKEFVHEGMRFSIPNPFAGGSGGDVPTVSDEASYNAIPTGQQYRTPDGKLKVKQGGPASAPGTFPGGGY